MAEPIVIVGCGRRKQAGTHPAAELYTGTLFLARWKAAQVIAPGRAWIISAKHGLLRPSQLVAWYDMKPGQPGSVTVRQLRASVIAYGLRDCPVTVLASAPYAALVLAAWPDGSVSTPLAHLGMGQQMARCKELAAGPGVQLARPSPGPAVSPTGAPSFAHRV